MPLHFLTFGNAPWHTSVSTLCEEARALGIFDSVRGFTEADLTESLRAYCDANPKGYGHWIWKPSICGEVLKIAKDDDVFVYADAGCVFNPPAIGRIHEYARLVRHTPLGVLGFQMPPHIEIQWTKRELFRKLGCENRRDVLYSPQVEATAFVFTKKALQFMNTWQYIATENPVNINDDITTEQYPEFREHRRDQSIFSLLMKLHGGLILGWETWCWGDRPEEYAMNPIWEKRRLIA